jgi:hypothetical protein
VKFDIVFNQEVAATDHYYVLPKLKKKRLINNFIFALFVMNDLTC